MLKSNNVKNIVIFGLFFFMCNVAYGCFKIPKYYSRPYERVLEEADSVFLGKVVSIEYPKELSNNVEKPKDLESLLESVIKHPSDKAIYKFAVIEQIKDVGTDSFVYLAGNAPELDTNGDFDGHRLDSDFWSKFGGRVRPSADCSLDIHFELGKTYLIIKGERDSYKSYERINSRNDFWLKAVIEYFE